MMKLAFVGLHLHTGDVNPARPQPGYLHSFRALPGVQVVAYCMEPDTPWGREDAFRLEALRAAGTGARFYGSVDDLLAQEDFDAALVLMPPSRVPDACIRLAAAKKHILCEKQFGRTAADFLPAVQAVQKSGVGFFAIYPWRMNPVAVEMRRLIAAGAVGRPLSLEMRLVSGQPGNPGRWMATREYQGGGILHTLGCHFIDLARSLMGVEVQAVSAVCRNQLGRLPPGLEDTAAVSLAWEGGAVGSLFAASLLPPGCPPDFGVVLRGSEGVLAWTPRREPEQLRLFSSSLGERVYDIFVRKVPLVYAEAQWNLDLLQSGLQALQAGAPPPCTLDDALRTLQIIDAAYAASGSGREVSLT